MRLINTRAHGIYDYLLGMLLLNTPYLFHFPAEGMAFKCAAAAAIFTFCTALFTRYEAGLFRMIPIRLHFWLDCACGTFLALSPWIFAFEAVVYKPHLVFGLSLIFVSVLTDRLPFLYVRQMLSKGKRTERDKGTINNFERNFHFIYSNGEKLIARFTRRHPR